MVAFSEMKARWRGEGIAAGFIYIPTATEETPNDVCEVPDNVWQKIEQLLVTLRAREGQVFIGDLVLEFGQNGERHVDARWQVRSNTGTPPEEHWEPLCQIDVTQGR